MRSQRTMWFGVAVLLTPLAVGCSESSSVGTTVPASVTSEAATTSSESSLPIETTSSVTVVDTTDEVTLPGEVGDLVAVWPAADVVLATPEEAASGFVSEVLGVPPGLGPFAAGDSRSGEIVLGVDGIESTDRGTLLLRQLGDSDGWFVIGVANDVSAVSWPEQGATVAAGPLAVTGTGHGFEASISVSAFLAGSPSVVFDTVVLQAGSMESPGPFETILDLSAAHAGDVVAIVVRGGVGLETDPGEIGAIAVVIG